MALDMSIGAFKGMAIGTIWGVAAIGGALPFILSRRAKRGNDVQGGNSAATLLSVLNAASGGVFLAAGLMHLLVDAIANEELARSSEEFWGEECANAVAFCVAGFVLLILVEQVAHLCTDGGHSHGDHKGGHDHDQGLLDGIQGMQDGDTAGSVLTAIVVGLGLSFHSIMEGLAIGAQTEVSQGMGIFLAVVAHKGIAAFALGNKVCSSMQGRGEAKRSTCYFALYMFLFSLMSPIGIAAAWYVTEELDPDNSPWTGVFGGLGAGTFLYVATVEVIPQELGSHSLSKGSRLLTLVSFLVGTGAMGILAKWA